MLSILDDNKNDTSKHQKCSQNQISDTTMTAKQLKLTALSYAMNYACN